MRDYIKDCKDNEDGKNRALATPKGPKWPTQRALILVLGPPKCGATTFARHLRDVIPNSKIHHYHPNYGNYVLITTTAEQDSADVVFQWTEEFYFELTKPHPAIYQYLELCTLPVKPNTWIAKIRFWTFHDADVPRPWWSWFKPGQEERRSDEWKMIVVHGLQNPVRLNRRILSLMMELVYRKYSTRSKMKSVADRNCWLYIWLPLIKLLK